MQHLQSLDQKRIKQPVLLDGRIFRLFCHATQGNVLSAGLRLYADVQVLNERIVTVGVQIQLILDVVLELVRAVLDLAILRRAQCLVVDVHFVGEDDKLFQLGTELLRGFGYLEL